MWITKLKIVAIVCALAGVQAATVAAQDRNVARGPADPILVLAQRVKFPGISDPKATIEDALNMLQARYGMTYDIRFRAFAQEGLKEPDQALIAEKALPPMEDTLQAVLNRLLARMPCSSGATFLIRGHHIEITTRAAACVEIWGVDYHGPYLPLVNFQAKQIPLSEALDQLADQLEVNIFSIVRAERSAKLVSGRFTNVPLDTAVRLLAGQAGLKVVHRDNVLVVMSAEQEAAMDRKRQAELPDRKHPEKYVQWRRGTLQPTLPPPELFD